MTLEVLWWRSATMVFLSVLALTEVDPTASIARDVSALNCSVCGHPIHSITVAIFLAHLLVSLWIGSQLGFSWWDLDLCLSLSAAYDEQYCSTEQILGGLVLCQRGGRSKIT